MNLFSRMGIVFACVVLWGGTLATAADTASTAVKTKKTVPATTTSHATKTHRKKKSRLASWRRGQQKVDPQRAREIQEALIREHYLKGTASGRWDDATQSAMQRYQAANGWQTRTVPDSRALIKLGLGPNHDHLLNPESAMTTGPQPRTANNAAPEAPRTPTQQK